MNLKKMIVTLGLCAGSILPGCGKGTNLVVVDARGKTITTLTSENNPEEYGAGHVVEVTTVIVFRDLNEDGMLDENEEVISRNDQLIISPGRYNEGDIIQTYCHDCFGGSVVKKITGGFRPGTIKTNSGSK